MLPGPGLGRLVVDEGLQLRGDRPLLPRRPQPHVDLVQRALGGRRRQRADQALRQARVVLLRRQRPRAVRLRRRVVEVVDEDEVEIGGGGHLAPAELAHGDDGRAAARHLPVRAHQLALDGALQRIDQPLGEQRVGAAGLVGLDGARQHAHADEELLLAADDARAVEHVLDVVLAVADLGGDEPVELLGRRQHAERARIEHGIEQPAAARQDARQARRRAHDVGEQPQQRRIGAQQREQLHAGRQLGEEAVEAGQRAVGIGGVGERRDQQRLHLGEAFARARRAHGRIAAVMPAADDGQHLGGLREAHLLQRRDGARIVLLAGEHHVDAARRSAPARPRTAPRSASAPSRAARSAARENVAVSGIARRTARSFRAAPDRPAPRASARRRPSAAGARCGAGRGRPRSARLATCGLIQPRSTSFASASSVCRDAQLRLAPAGDQLLRLHEELDLADAAAAELDVVAGDGDVRRSRGRRGSAASWRACRRWRRSRGTCAR